MPPAAAAVPEMHSPSSVQVSPALQGGLHGETQEDPTEITLADILKKCGYSVPLIGKWHLCVSRKQAPLARGFDYQFGFNRAFSLYSPERNWGNVVHEEQ